MSDPTHKIIIPVPLLHGKKAFLTGIDWNNKPASFRNVRSFAQSQNADFYLSYQYRDNESKDSNTMVAIFRRKEADIPRNIQKYYSLAMLIRPILKSGGYAIFDVPSSNDEKKYGFVSVVNEILVNDVTGTRDEIAEARNTFLMLNTEPENGWIRYEPEIFSENDKHTVLPLTTLTEAKKHPADARFTPVSMGKQLITASMFIALIGASWFAWQYYQNWQAEKTAREEAARKAVAEQSPPPWLSQPENREFIRGCSHAWSSLPLSVVGWRFTLAECQANGTSGNLRASYTNIAGTTVSDFSLRITEIFGTTPFMVMPEGNSGGFSLPVNFQLSQTPLSVDTLPTVPALQEQLTTFSQSMRIKIDWREVNNSITDDEGNTIQPPWKEYDLEMQTDIPPFALFENFSNRSVHFSGVTMQLLDGGRLRYQLTGKFYAR